jgi:hypothetical protein
MSFLSTFSASSFLVSSFSRSLVFSEVNLSPSLLSSLLIPMLITNTIDACKMSITITIKVRKKERKKERKKNTKTKAPICPLMVHKKLVLIHCQNSPIWRLVGCLTEVISTIQKWLCSTAGRRFLSKVEIRIN